MSAGRASSSAGSTGGRGAAGVTPGRGLESMQDQPPPQRSATLQTPCCTHDSSVLRIHDSFASPPRSPRDQGSPLPPRTADIRPPTAARVQPPAPSAPRPRPSLQRQRAHEHCAAEGPALCQGAHHWPGARGAPPRPQVPSMKAHAQAALGGGRPAVPQRRALPACCLLARCVGALRTFCGPWRGDARGGAQRTGGRGCAGQGCAQWCLDPESSTAARSLVCVCVHQRNGPR